MRGAGRVVYSATSGSGNRPGAVVARELSDPPVEVLRQWDELVAASGYPDVSQLSDWARVRAGAGYRSRYVIAEADGRVVGGAQVFLRDLPVLGTVAYLPYGPLLAPEALQAPTRVALCDALRRLVRPPTRVLLVQPPEGGTDLSMELLRRGFRRSEAGIAPAASLRIDLDRTEDQLRSQLSRRLRSWTRQWPHRGVRVRVGGAADIDTVATLAAHTGSYQGFTSFTSTYLRSLYDALAPDGHVLILVAEVTGRPVAAELLTACGGVLKSRLTGFDRSDPAARGLNVSAAVIWEAIRWGRQHGCRWFDFGGIGAASADRLLSGQPIARDSLPGPDQFKLGFGPQAFRYPQAVEFIHPGLRLVYDVSRRAPAGRVALERAKTFMRMNPLPAQRRGPGDLAET